MSKYFKNYLWSTQIHSTCVIICICLSLSNADVVKSILRFNRIKVEETKVSFHNSTYTNNTNFTFRDESVGNASICMSTTCMQTASKLLKNMNQNIDPCDNFYQFACGGFINSTIIPDDKSKITHFVITDNNIKQLLKLGIEKESLSNEPRVIHLAKKYYQICMNQTDREQLGIIPLINVLENLGGWPVLERNSWNEDNFDWIKSILKFRDMGYSTNYFIEFSISPDAKNNSKHIINLKHANLALNINHYKRGLSHKIIQKYHNYMVNIAIMLGAEREYATKELLKSLEFERNLAKISLSSMKHRNDSKRYNPMTIREMNEKFSSIPWKDVFNTLLFNKTVDDNEVFNVIYPDYISDFQKLIASTPKRTQANYAFWRVVHKSLYYLTKEMQEIKNNFTKIAIPDFPIKLQWQTCLDSTINNFPLSIHSLYIRLYGDKDVMIKATRMASHIKTMFQKSLSNINWMDDDTKKNAVEKLMAMQPYIVYPEELLNDTKLNEYDKHINLTNSDYLKNYLKVQSVRRRKYFHRFNHLADRTDWITHSKTASVKVYTTLNKNTIDIPAGILQDAFFNKNLPAYMNYGSMGFAIGHEITHGFSQRGRLYDKDGNLNNWWSPTTAENFEKIAQCIIDQSRKFTISDIGLALNGNSTLTETICDNGAAKIAYYAYKDWEESRSEREPQLPGLNYTSRQMFWLSSANMWCASYRPEFLKKGMKKKHPPHEFRVLGTFRNMAEFADDFDCPTSSNMNPVNKCLIL